MLDHVTPTRARDLMERHGLATKRSLGQHFLVDPNTVDRIVRMAGVGRDETILEVGPGLGSLTVGLARTGARVIALELDAGVADALRDVVFEAPNVEVVVADALRTDLGRLCGGPARLVSNLPYNVATPILARVLDEVPEISGGLVMVQRELGERWCAGPGSKTYGAISVKVTYHADARIEGEVPRTVFLPPPKVSSVLVSFARRPPPVAVDDPASFFGFVEGAFRYRRKTIRNALASAGIVRDDAFSRCGVDPGDRPERLRIEDFACLYGAGG